MNSQVMYMPGTYIKTQRKESEQILKSVYDVGYFPPIEFKKIVLSFWRVLTSNVE